MSTDAAASRARWHAARARWQATRRRWHHSLKWRLVTLFLLLALAMTGVFLLGMQRVLSSGWTSYARPIAADYIDRLAAEIGSPPDAARAEALVARLPISVRIEGPQLNYDSHPGDRARRHWSGEGEGDGYGPARFSFERTTADGHRVTFGLTSPVQSTRPRFFGWLTLGVLLLLTIAAYAFVRRLLRPLESIDAGVTRFGAGDFAQPIVTPRRDELGDLAERINTMARSLQGMLDAKRALLLAISHELRSPLTRARVNAELVPEGEHRDALLRDLAAMRDLIADLLESEHLASGHAALQTETVHLPALVRALVDAQFAGVALTLRLDDAMPPVQADPMRLKLLLRNLIDNALRHAAGAPRPPEVTLAREADGQVLLRVRDHGPGVSDEQLAQLAQPLYRSDAARQRATGGAGLGLYLCLLIVKAHGGRLVFERAEPGLAVSARWPAG